MIASIVKSITNLFGNKSQRDVKDLWPVVAEINLEIKLLSLKAA
jgi:hypothetical protein